MYETETDFTITLCPYEKEVEVYVVAKATYDHRGEYNLSKIEGFHQTTRGEDILYIINGLCESSHNKIVETAKEQLEQNILTTLNEGIARGQHSA